MEFRRATLADLESVLEMMPLYYEADHLPFDRAIAERTFREFVGNPEFGQFWIFRDTANQGDIGYLIVTNSYRFECGGREAFVDELFVRSEYRCRGYGTAAIQHALTEGKRLGIQALRLEVTGHNLSALKLYQKLGFEDFDRSLLTYTFRDSAH